MKLRIPAWLREEASFSENPVLVRIADCPTASIELTEPELRELRDLADYQAYWTDEPEAAHWRRRYRGLLKRLEPCGS